MSEQGPIRSVTLRTCSGRALWILAFKPHRLPRVVWPTRWWLPIFGIALLIVAPAARAWSQPPAPRTPQELFAADRLVAWCIVPFDANRRGPEERAAMLRELGMRRVAYDWRDEHIPTFDAELDAYDKHEIELTAFWMPVGTAQPLSENHWKVVLDLVKRHGVRTQFWVMLNEGLLGEGSDDQRARRAAALLEPVAEAAGKLGCSVGLYNHGGWFGQPENQLAIIAQLKRDNVGIVYNLHHGHEHLSRFPELLARMKPHLLCLNLNGMRAEGPKILPLGEGTHDRQLLQQIWDSGYRGAIGILDHRPELDAREALQLNLRGLEKLRKELQATKPQADEQASFRRLQYGQPEMIVDLGVGLWAWPLPMDYDGDGDLDLVVVCPDKPYNGTYFFENPGGSEFPVFRPGVRLSGAQANPQVSYIDGRPRVLTPGREWVDFPRRGFVEPRQIHARSNLHPQRVRANQWKYSDLNDDGRLDLVVGVGDWTEYGWDNAYDSSGKWTRGPLRGYVYWLRNRGTSEQPDYAEPVKLTAGGEEVDVFGMPSPNLGDFDGDGDLDLLCGEFLDGFTYFPNVGNSKEPAFARGIRLTREGRPLAMDLQMIVPVAVDWDADGDLDLVVGDEDGRVALLTHEGLDDRRVPVFSAPRYFQQAAADVKFGALATPVGFDWDGDGDQDLVAGNTAGYIGWFENLDGGHPPRWSAPRLVMVGEKPFRVQAGPNGSIQGPAEAKWGYTTLSVADWDHDGLPDLIVNSIWGRVEWLRNTGTRSLPAWDPPRALEVAWRGEPPKPAWNWWDPEGGDLVTQWRTTPCVLDWNADGLNDLVMLDHEGYLAFFARRRSEAGNLVLEPGERMFEDEQGQPLRLNDGVAGKSGRRKLCFADWDGDGRLDLLVNSKNVDWYRHVPGENGRVRLLAQGSVSDQVLAGHTTSPTTVDWNADGVPDLVAGAEDGRMYYLLHPRSASRHSPPHSR